MPFPLPAASSQSYVDGEVLVKFKKHIQGDSSRKAQAIKDMGAKTARHFPLNDIYLLRLDKHGTVAEMVNKLKSHPDVEYAEPNYRKKLMATTPNDPLFSSQWGLQNIHAPDAWQTAQGSKGILVAFGDSGIDLNHQDLRDNLWANPAEVCGNGIDDDGNGYVDDCYGANVITGSGSPMDDEGHGTHVAGIVGAVGNNNLGISGINWKVSLMALKFIAADGTGTLADEIKAIEYAVKKGARVFNMSFGGYDLSNSEKDAISNAVNILFVAAACNESKDNDATPCYPASFDLPNIISVAATDQNDNLAFFSNYGMHSVSVGAPGVNIKSTYLGQTYKSLSGTSMSTPFVTGLAALVLSKYPSLTVPQLKGRILRTADTVPGLQGKTLTGGRINAYRALTDTITGPYIYQILPAKGQSGSEVTIEGSNFKTSQGTVVFSGNVNATIVSWSDYEIVVKVPDTAVTGPVYVTTSEGKSNAVNFEVTSYPTSVRIAFPHASTENGQVSYLIVSNPLSEAVSVLIHIVGVISGEETFKTINLSAFEKNILNLGLVDAVNDSIFVECESRGFFGAAIVTIGSDNKVTAMPPIIGGPLHLVAPPPR